MRQESGDLSTNIQVGGDAQFGISYTEARQIALDVFNANFYDLSEKAAQKATERAQEFTEDFLEKYFKASPDTDTSKFEEPGIQSSIYEAQKAYAKTGDKDLEDRLIITLLERLHADERSLRQIVLDEAIALLPKLTDNEVSLLSFCISISHINYEGINDIPSFEIYFEKAWLDFFPENITTNEATHLLYCGGYTMPSGGPLAFYSLGEYLSMGYKGLLTNGFTEEEFSEATNGMRFSEIGEFIITNPRFPERFQFNSLNDNIFNYEAGKLNLGERVKLLQTLWQKSAMTKEQVHELLISMNPKSKTLIFNYNRTGLPGFRLSPVGYAIGTLNLNQKLNSNFDFMSFTPRQ